MSFTFVPCNQCEKINRVLLGRAEAETPVCGNCKTSLPVEHGVVELNGASLQHLLDRSSFPLIVDFWAPSCAPCRAFDPEFQRAAQQFAGQVVFGKLNAQQHFLATGVYGIRSVPTLVLFQHGSEIDRRSGAISAQELAHWLDSTSKDKAA